MDYKEKYDKALKVAQRFYNNSVAITKKGLEDIFPELAGSEDERIRKDIMHHIEFEYNHNTIPHQRAELWIAWLEKQGKKDEEILVLKDQIESLRAAREALKEVHKIELEKLGGKKPIKDICDTCDEKASCVNPCSVKLIEEQKPVWSEEDKMMLQYAIEHFERQKRNCIEGGGRKKSMQELIDWLKSLKDRVQPQPRQEWSEEGKELLDYVCSILTDNFNENDKFDLEKPCIGALVDWLKSLRPQSQWKPSDMELEVLRLAAEKDGTCLMGLYEQLKKLREE